MNILFFSRLFHPHIGGVEKHIFEISKILIQNGHKIHIVAEKHDSELKNFEIINSIEVYRISDLKEGWFKKFKIWKWLWINHKLIDDADVVHCHDVFFWYLPFRFLYFRKPVFTTFHGYESYPLKSKDILMHKISEKLSMGNICVGDFMKKWYGTKPNFVTYGGVDKYQISNIKNQKLENLNNSSAIFVGRLDEQTGILTYVNAVKSIRKKLPNFKFEIIGDGKFRKEIEKNSKVLGFKNNPEKYFANYRFAFVSRYLSILEAIAAKRLVFAVYDNPLKEDYLRMTPFAKLINIAGTDDELAEKVLYFLKNKRKEEIMLNEAFELIKNQTWGRLADIYLGIWRHNEKNSNY